MVAWLQTVLALLQMAPQILQLIVQLEGIFGKGQGAVKKSMIMNTVNAASPPASVVSATSNLIDTHVATLNTSGVFKKGD